MLLLHRLKGAFQRNRVVAEQCLNSIVQRLLVTAPCIVQYIAHGALDERLDLGIHNLLVPKYRPLIAELVHSLGAHSQTGEAHLVGLGWSA